MCLRNVLLAVAVTLLGELRFRYANLRQGRCGRCFIRRCVQARQDRVGRHMRAFLKRDGRDAPHNPEAQVDLSDVDVSAQDEAVVMVIAH